MFFIHWAIGPQLIGMIFIIVALLQKRYPPKEINPLYGYRTTRSMKNQQNWDEGNRYSTRLMLKAGLILVILGVIITIILQHLSDDEKFNVLLNVGLIVAAAIITVIGLFRSTEAHLKRTFGDTPQ